jgi:hypothetical protein
MIAIICSNDLHITRQPAGRTVAGRPRVVPAQMLENATDDALVIDEHDRSHLVGAGGAR